MSNVMQKEKQKGDPALILKEVIQRVTEVKSFKGQQKAYVATFPGQSQDATPNPPLVTPLDEDTNDP